MRLKATEAIHLSFGQRRRDGHDGRHDTAIWVFWRLLWPYRYSDKSSCARPG